ATVSTPGCTGSKREPAELSSLEHADSVSATAARSTAQSEEMTREPIRESVRSPADVRIAHPGGLRSSKSSFEGGSMKKMMIGSLAAAAVGMFGATAEAGSSPSAAKTPQSAALLKSVKVTAKDLSF